MRVLLTEGGGFLGTHALDALHCRSYDVVVIGSCPPANLGRARFIAADLLGSPDWPALVRQAAASSLMHLAWYAEHGKYWASPLNLRWVEATVQLVEAFCEGDGRKVVVSDTCAEYDWSWGYCRENATPLAPATLYGTAKDATRRLVMAVRAQHRMLCAWGRVFLPYGRGGALDRFVPSLTAALLGQRQPFAINSTALHDSLHVTDVANTLTALLEADANGAFNICSGQPTALADIAHLLARHLGADPDPILALEAFRLGEPLLLVGEALKMQAFGWRPALTLDQGLARCAAEAKVSS